MKKLSLISTFAAICLLATTGAQAAWVTIQDLNGQVKFEGGNAGENYQFSVDGIHFNGPSNGLAASNTGSSSSSSYSLFISNAQAYTDYSIYFVASGMLVAELAFDYLGDFANQSDVQKITYSNHIAQGHRYAAPTTGDVRLMTNDIYNSFSVPESGFESHSDQLFFYNKGIVVEGRDIPEPASLALSAVGLALAAVATRRRRT